jgi:hypothetical protein
MSRRDEGNRGSRSTAQTSIRTNEYFVPRDGIDREVITADICRYLGNDALVRPGSYEDPQTREVKPGYFITAYRNLTTAMIADLKADSDRWEAERRATSSQSRGGQSLNAEYRSSATHQTRQYYGPSAEAAPQVNTPLSHSSGPSSVTMGGTQQQEVYGPSAGYPQSYSQQGSSYAQSQGYSQPDYNNYAATSGVSNAYVTGGHLEPVEPQRSTRGAPAQPPTQTIPRTNYPPTSSTYPAQSYYPQTGQQGPPQQQYAPQQPTQYYGRGAYSHCSIPCFSYL